MDRPTSCSVKRQSLRDERDHVLAKSIALPEVALQRAAQPGDVLAERIPDQPELLAEHLGRRRIHLLPAEDDQDRIARGESDQAERDERDEEEHGDERDQPPQRIPDHLVPGSEQRDGPT
ncbi:MAG: hypothetical protein WKF78_15085 [Candidatus Limnocylindrales bacterium]